MSQAEVVGRRPAARVDRSGQLVELWLRLHTIAVYLFLFIPIVVVVVFSFNDTDRRVTDWGGLGVKWYGRVLGDKIIQGHLMNSLIVGTSTAIIATTFGTLAALGLQRVPKWFRIPFDALTYVSVIIPEIVIALATLVFFATSFDITESLTGFRMRLGFPTIIAAHALFNISLVLLLVQARLSGMDRDPRRGQLRPLRDAMAGRSGRSRSRNCCRRSSAGFLLSFTFSFGRLRDHVVRVRAGLEHAPPSTCSARSRPA
jgi:spermidine/putrescine transport system permease protein